MIDKAEDILQTKGSMTFCAKGCTEETYLWCELPKFEDYK